MSECRENVCGDIIEAEMMISSAASAVTLFRRVHTFIIDKITFNLIAPHSKYSFFLLSIHIGTECTQSFCFHIQFCQGFF